MDLSQSTKKYSCSGPTDTLTLVAVVFPKSFTILRACLLIASIDLRSGVFLSSASPVYEQKAVGMQSVTPAPDSLRKAGEVISQAVYPLASKVALSPPDGKDDASGSPFISSLPENEVSILPSFSALPTKESCFSAVIPVRGWNQ